MPPAKAPPAPPPNMSAKARGKRPVVPHPSVLLPVPRSVAENIKLYNRPASTSAKYNAEVKRAKTWLKEFTDGHQKAKVVEQKGRKKRTTIGEIGSVL